MATRFVTPGEAEAFIGDGDKFMQELGKQFELNASFDWPVFKLKHKSLIMIKVKPVRLTVLNLDSSLYPKTVWPGYYQII